METLGVAILVLLILRAVFYAARFALLWYLIAVLLFAIGLFRPAVGCLVLGTIVSLDARTRE